MCLTILELFCYMIITCFDLVTSYLGVDPLCFVLFVVWALNANRWYVREWRWTRTGRSIYMTSMRTTLGRPTTLGRSVTTSEDVPLRNETLLLEETLISVFSVEEYDCQSNQ